MASTIDCLTRAEAQLGALTRGHERLILNRWRDACSELGASEPPGPAQLRDWLRDRPTRCADEVLRGLIGLAQRGDGVALVAVLVCLAPGIRSLAARTGVRIDEAMSEVTVGILDYPVARRSVVAAGVLLDARNRITRSARRAPAPWDLAPEDDTSVVGAAGQPGERTAAERVLSLICEARRRDLLSRDDAQLVVDTRLSGMGVAPAAARLGISAPAAYQRRTRAERRMAQLV